MKQFLADFQLEAVEKMHNGCILNGGVGSGKSRTSLYYYYTLCGGSIKDNVMIPMTNPIDLYIITTASKRDKLEWEEELAHYGISKYPDCSVYSNKITIDSWNNIKKYTDVENAFFLFDEDKVTGYGAWVKAFLKIAKKNKWIILSATPGDKWEDYMPVFIANGFYKNKTDFDNCHINYRSVKYGQKYIPVVDSYRGMGLLIKHRNDILIPMNFERNTVPHHIDVTTNYDVALYREVTKNRWNPYEDRPIRNAAELCYIWRKIVNSDNSRLDELKKIYDKHHKVILFYSYDYERELLINFSENNKIKYSEWSGHKHQPVPSGPEWIYLVNYSSGSEGWNNTDTDCIVFYSQSYSYKSTKQASGRIDRFNTPFIDLYYYHFKSKSKIDLAISLALSRKKDFNEAKYVSAFDFKE